VFLTLDGPHGDDPFGIPDYMVGASLAHAHQGRHRVLAQLVEIRISDHLPLRFIDPLCQIITNPTSIFSLLGHECGDFNLL